MRLAFALSLLLFGTVAIAQDGQPGSVLTGATEGLTQEQVAMIEAPVRAWEAQRDAVIAARDAASIDDVLDVVRSGAAMRLAGRDPADEVLKAVPAPLLSSLFAHAANDKTPTYAAALARKRIAEEVGARGDLHELRDAALLERARLSFVTSESRDEVRQAIASLASATGDSGTAGRLSGYLAALETLRTPDDFDAARDVLDIATLYNARLQANWVAAPIVETLRDESAAPFAPARWGGDSRPAVMAARAAFELGQTELLRNLDAQARNWDMPAEARNEFLYWIGMDGFASARYDDALSAFDRIEALGAMDAWSAYAAVRRAQTFMLRREHFKAAVFYLDAMELFPQFPDAVREADKGLNFLLDAGLIDEKEARTAAVRRRDDRQTAMALSAAGGGR